MLTNGTFRLVAQVVSGNRYHLLADTRLKPPVSWVPRATNYADGHGFLIITDYFVNNYIQQFYQISIP